MDPNRELSSIRAQTLAAKRALARVNRTFVETINSEEFMRIRARLPEHLRRNIDKQLLNIAEEIRDLNGRLQYCAD